jgi:hypothetical protein
VRDTYRDVEIQALGKIPYALQISNHLFGMICCNIVQKDKQRIA